MNLVIVLLLLPVVYVNAQRTGETVSPERGFNPGKSYAISEIESVSPESGNLMFNLPLGSLSAGRGGMSGGVSLQYNSKIWEMKGTISLLDLPNGSYPTRYPLTLSDEGNWRYAYRYGLWNKNSVPCEEGLGYVNKPSLVMPDGSKRGLHLAAHTDGEGFTNLNFDGTVANCPTENSSVTPITGTVTYFTTDGTFLRVDILQDSDSDRNNNPFVIYSPDGSRVAYKPAGVSGVLQRTFDRNGNFVDVIETANDSAYDNHRTTTLKDEFNRKVVIEYDADPGGNPNRDHIHSAGIGGANLITKVDWKTVRVQKTHAPCSTASCYGTTLDKNVRVVEKVFLPEQLGNPAMDDLFYDFDYNAEAITVPTVGWGEVSKVTLPSGAYATYDYANDNQSDNSMISTKVLANRVTSKTLNYKLEYDGATPVWTSETTAYALTYVNQYEEVATTTVTGPNGAQTKEYFDYAGNTGSRRAWRTEMPDGSKSERIFAANQPLAGIASNIYLKYEFTSIRNASGNFTQTAIKEFAQDKNGNQTETKEYDFVPYANVPRNGNGKPTGLPSNAASYLKRISKTDFYNDTPDAASTNYTDTDSYHLASNPRLLRLAKSAEVQTSAGSAQTRSEIIYDYTNYNSANTKGGNPTATATWDNFKGGTNRAYSNPLTATNSVSSSVAYDQYGNPTQTTDAKGTISTITYGNITTPSGIINGLYPTQTETASNYSALKRTSTAQYDFHTGLPTLATDVDNNVTSATEYDDLGRPVKSKAAVGTPLEIWTTTEYDDLNRRVISRSDLETKGDGKKIAVQHYDQLGRVRLTRQIENVATEDPTNEQHGIKVQTRYETGNPHSYQLSSNPYRAATSNAASNEQSMGWTRSKSINTGKRSEVETFTGANLPAPWGNNTASTGIATTDIDAERTLVTDQAGKRRISQANALGQLINVWEVKESDSDTEAISFGTLALNGLKTSYSYDTLSNLTTVNQGVQTRSFAYSSLARLKSANNPESGIINYNYDDNGNLTSKIDARNITTSYVYDALNRVTNRNYSAPANLSNYQATPNVTYFYDNLPNAKGKLTKVDNGFSKTEYTEFDLLGRVKKSKQTTDGTAYNEMEYAYNLSGAMIEQKYPSGRVVRNVLDNDGDLAMVQSKRNANSGFWNYAKHFTYTSAGAVSSMQLGNSKWESTTFNSRLQPTQIALGNVQNATTDLKLNFTYNTTGQNDNNGNVLSQTITVPTVGVAAGFTAVQTYTYDSLNRIRDAKELIGSTQEWKQTFTYDRYGNRSFDESGTSGNYLTTTLQRNCSTSAYNPNGICDKKKVNPKFALTNRIEQNQDGTNDYLFDSAGNTTKDASGQTFIYDAENKQIEVKNSLNQTIGKYFYDGDGKRVKKISAAETTIFVYNANGQLVAEYSTQIAQAQDAKVSYLTNDHLGSPRITTDANGQVISRRDFQPFGEEITRANYGTDNVRQKFTGYLKDEETDLDFAQARYFNPGFGRFSSPDDFLNDTHNSDPQSWNLYLYVRNNPLKYIDPEGKEIWILFSETDATTGKISPSRVQYKNGKLYGTDGKEYKGGNDYVSKVFKDIGILRNSSEKLSARIDVLSASKNIHDIKMTEKAEDGNTNTPQSPNDDKKGIPTGTTTIYNPDKNTTVKGDEFLPPVGLAHELLGHGYDSDQGQTDYGKTENDISKYEISAVNVENIARKALGSKKRTKFGGEKIPKSLLWDTHSKSKRN